MKKIVTILSMFALPGVALAASDSINTSARNLTDLAQQLQQLANWVIVLIMALAIIIFFWGVVMYVIKPGPEDKATAKGYIIYGIIGLAVMVGVWGLVRLLTQTFGVDNQQAVPLPQVPTK